MRARPLVLLLLVLAVARAWSRHVQDDIRTGAVLSRGVNLGAWLVIEHFMTETSPIWRHVPADKRDWGEYTAMRLVGHAVADPLIKAHRDTWITEADIKEIASYGLNTVRVPVGWWIYEDPTTDDWRAFTPGSLAYLDRLINEWAVTHNVAVLIDIHAAKGSQNGNDNSSPVTKGESHFTNNVDNVLVTITTAQFLVNRYAESTAFLGLELLNEPTFDPKHVHKTDETKLKLYYASAYPSLRSICGNCVLLMSPFLSEQYESFGHKWANVLPSHRNNWIDWHKYLIWGFETWPMERLITEGTRWIANDMMQWKAHRDMRVFVGEWSLAHGDLVRHDLRNPINMRWYSTHALKALQEANAGWTYWSWKTHATDWRGDGWSLQNLLRAGVIDLKALHAPHTVFGSINTTNATAAPTIVF